MRSKVKGEGRKVTWSVWQVLAHKSRTKSPQNIKIVNNIAHPTGNNAHQVRGQKVTRPINAETESVTPHLTLLLSCRGWLSVSRRNLASGNPPEHCQLTCSFTQFIDFNVRYWTGTAVSRILKINQRMSMLSSNCEEGRCRISCRLSESFTLLFTA